MTKCCGFFWSNMPHEATHETQLKDFCRFPQTFNHCFWKGQFWIYNIWYMYGYHPYTSTSSPLSSLCSLPVASAAPGPLSGRLFGISHIAEKRTGLRLRPNYGTPDGSSDSSGIKCHYIGLLVSQFWAHWIKILYMVKMEYHMQYFVLIDSMLLYESFLLRPMFLWISHVLFWE